MELDPFKYAFAIQKVRTFASFRRMYGSQEVEKVKAVVESSRCAVYGENLSVAGIIFLS